MVGGVTCRDMREQLGHSGLPRGGEEVRQGEDAIQGQEGRGILSYLVSQVRRNAFYREMDKHEDFFPSRGKNSPGKR